MTRAQIEARIRGHILHPVGWGRYWIASAWARLFWYAGFGIPQWSDPLKETVIRVTEGDAIIRSTNTLSLSLKQRLKILLGGSLVLRHSVVVIPEKFEPIGSIVDIQSLPPGVFMSAAEVHKWDVRSK